jgi:hypothetical protein
MDQTTRDQGAAPEFPPEMKAKLEQISAARNRYEQTEDLRCLDQVVQAWEAILLNPDFARLHEGLRMLSLNSAGEAYVARSHRTQEMIDLDRGLELRKEAMMIMHRTHPDLPDFPDLLSNLARDFWNRYERTHDARHLQEYGDLVRQLPPSHINTFAHLTTLGIAFVTRYDDTKAIADMDDAIRCFKDALATRPAEVSALNNLAKALWTRYHLTRDAHYDARYFEEYKQVVQKFPPTSDELASHLNNLAIGQWDQFEDTRDARYFDEYKQIVQKLPPSHIPDHLNNLGTGQFSRYETTGEIADLQESIRFFERSIAETPAQSLPRLSRRSWFDSLLGKSPDPKVDDESPQNRRCRTLSNLGTALMARYSHVGNPSDLEQAIQTLQQSVDQTLRGSSELAVRLASLGDALRLRYLRTQAPDDLDAATQKFELSVAHIEPESPDLPSVLVSRGIGLIERYEKTGKAEDLKAAIADFRKAVDNSPPTSPDRPAYLNSLGTGLSELYDRTGEVADLDAGIRAFSEAAKLAQHESSGTPHLANYLNNLSNVLAFRYKRTGVQTDLEAAIQYSKDAIAKTDSGSPMLPSFLANLGSRLQSRFVKTTNPADLEAALSTWERGLRSLHASFVIASVSFKLGTERAWPTLYSNVVSAYLTQMEVEPLKAQSSLRRAIEVAEQSKSSLLVEQFNRASMPLPPNISAEKGHREEQLLAELTQMDAMELATFGKLEPKQQRGGWLQHLRQRDTLREELQTIWTLMEKSGPQAASYVALRRGEGSIWDDLARLTTDLGTDTALLSLFTTRENSVIFIVRQGQEPCWIEGQISNAAWNNIWAKLVDEVHNYDVRRGAGESWDRPLQRLLEKTYAELPSIKRVILAPHSLGHLIPWSAAISRLGLRSPSENPLPIVTVPTLKLATGFRPLSSSDKNGKTLVVGNPLGDLEFAEKEARAVGMKLGAQALIRRQATKEAVSQGLANASIVHLATHAFSSKSSPLDSGIVLADGVLSAREVMHLSLRTDLLVLSACETGLGASLGGDELAGLGRAFMYAGVRSMLVSLWKINDMATAELMAAFYDAYCGGADKAEALSQAMGKIRAQQRWQHSYYWGSFILMGNWD